MDIETARCAPAGGWGEVSGENTMESLQWGSDIHKYLIKYLNKYLNKYLVFDKGDSSGLGYSVWYKSCHIENNI